MYSQVFASNVNAKFIRALALNNRDSVQFSRGFWSQVVSSTYLYRGFVADHLIVDFLSRRPVSINKSFIIDKKLNHFAHSQ